MKERFVESFAILLAGLFSAERAKAVQQDRVGADTDFVGPSSAADWRENTRYKN